MTVTFTGCPFNATDEGVTLHEVLKIFCTVHCSDTVLAIEFVGASVTVVLACSWFVDTASVFELGVSE